MTSAPSSSRNDPVPWLSDEQQRVWRLWLQASHRIQTYLDEQLHLDGLDLAEYEVLVCLSEAPGRRMRMSVLAHHSRQSRSRLTHTISRMEKAGLVLRTADPHDRRGVVANLTDDGIDLIDRAAPSHVRAVRRVLVDVADPTDLAALGRVMQAVTEVEL